MANVSTKSTKEKTNTIPNAKVLEPLKNVQLKLTAPSYEALSNFAEERGAPMATIIRDAIALYVLMAQFAKQGNKFYVEDQVTKEKSQLIITGLR
jgi:Ribbon-helix-helix protein, copG family